MPVFVQLKTGANSNETYNKKHMQVIDRAIELRMFYQLN